MQGHRLLRGVGILIIIVAIVYLLLAIGGAVWLGNRGLGDGWGTGWNGWLTIPLAGGAIFAALMLLVFGLMLFFLAKIDNNIAEAERRRAEAAARPRIQPVAAEGRVESVNLPAAPAVEPSAVAPVAAVAATAAAAAALPEEALASVPETAVVVEEALIEPGAPWEETAVAAETPAATVAEDIVVVEDADLPVVEAAAAAAILPTIEIEAPREDWGAVAAEVEAGRELAVDAPELAVEPSDLELSRIDMPAVELPDVVAEAPALDVDLPQVELAAEAPAIDMPDIELPDVVAEAPALDVDLPRVDVSELAAEAPAIDMPDIELPDVVAEAPALDVELPQVEMAAEAPAIDMPDIELPDVVAEAPALELSAAALDDLNVPPVLPEGIELPRVDVAAPELELETEDMSGRGAGLVGAALGAGAVAALSGVESEPEPVIPPAVETRLPEIEIAEVAPEVPAAAAVTEPEVTLATATGIPESEAAPEPPAAQTEVAQLRSEVASLKEMMAQLLAQLTPATGAAAAGAAAVGATAVSAAAAPAPQTPVSAAEPVEPPAVVDPSSRLPGADEVARIAAEVKAATPRRPRTVARPSAPTPSEAEPVAPQPPAIEPIAPEPPVVETRLPEPVEIAAPEPVNLAPGEDNLEAIVGLGPIYAKRLRELGVSTFAQLADAPYDVLHKVTRGNLERVIKEDWRGQARRLAKKD